MSIISKTMEQLLAAEFQYNDKKHLVIGYIPFELWITFIEGKPNNRDRITKTRNFFQETTQKLRNSKDIDEKDKRSHEEAV